MALIPAVVRFRTDLLSLRHDDKPWGHQDTALLARCSSLLGVSFLAWCGLVGHDTDLEKGYRQLEGYPFPEDPGLEEQPTTFEVYTRNLSWDV